MPQDRQTESQPAQMGLPSCLPPPVIMGDLIRLNDIPGFNGPGARVSSLGGQEGLIYSPEIRTLCSYRMDERRPDRPKICPRCTRKSNMKAFLTYKPGLAAAIGFSVRVLSGVQAFTHTVR